jgi:hypothetical protein
MMMDYFHKMRCAILAHVSAAYFACHIMDVVRGVVQWSVRRECIRRKRTLLQLLIELVLIKTVEFEPAE